MYRLNIENITLNQIIVKLASRCNINCSYCYWFRDKSVYENPKLLLASVQEAFLKKLENYITRYSILSFAIIFHGGEPLLFNKLRFIEFCEDLRSLGKKLNTNLSYGITTNGILIDDEWANIFKKYSINVAISIDGNQDTHDRSRKDFNGNGTFNKAINGLNILKKNDLKPTILSVCNPNSDPEDLFSEFVDKLNINYFDVLIPVLNYEDNSHSIASYYCKLFDCWYDRYAAKGSRVRILDSMMAGLLNIPNMSIESVGYGELTLITMMTDGSLEPTDTLRIVEEGFSKSSFNVIDNELHEIFEQSLWYEALRSSVNLADECNNCRYKNVCGGGPLQTRWSSLKRFDNPSVFCNDLQVIYDHISRRLVGDMCIK